MSVEGYAYISLVLPIQQEQAGVQGELMSRRRYCFDQGSKVRIEEAKLRGYMSKYIDTESKQL